MHQGRSTRGAFSTFLHEGQHAEQAWTVARAAATDGMTAEQMVKGVDAGGLGIPADVAKEAAARPLPKGSAGYQRGRALFTAEYNTAFGETYTAQLGLIHDAEKAMAAARTRYDALADAAAKGPPPTRYAQQQLAEAKVEYDAKEAAYEAEFRKYREFAGEAEAHAVEDAVLRHRERAARTPPAR
jgi:hypothetical protein